MTFDPQAGVTDMGFEGQQRRRCGRLEQEAVKCDAGRVLDMSAGGMHVLCRRPPRKRFVTRIRGLDMDLAVRARLVWVKRVGFLKFEVGVEFIDVSPELHNQLTRLAMTNRNRRTL